MPPRPPRRPPPTNWLDRLDEVRDQEDRRATVPLVSLFLSGSLGPEAEIEVASTLSALEDLRCVEPLEGLVLDPRAGSHSRRLALEVLASIPFDDPPRARVERWLADPDPLVRAYGLQFTDVPDAREIVAAAVDEDPVVRWAAVDAMASITRTRELVAALRHALSDDDAVVRETACRVALFDEPLDASRELLHALGDPSRSVRAAACDALEDYPRVAVLLALADARSAAGADADAEWVESALDAVADRVVEGFRESSAASRRRLERWAAPAAWLVEQVAARGAGRRAAEVRTAADPSVRTAEELPPVDLRRARRVLTSADASPGRQRRLLVRRSWRTSGGAGRALLGVCAASPNWGLRQGAAYALGDLGPGPELVALAHDGEAIVRRSALEVLRELGDPAGLPAARETLADPRARPAAGDAALGLLVDLAPRDEAERAVVEELSRPDDRDGLFLSATHHALELRVTRAVAPLLAIVNAPIVGAVLPHVAALEALRLLGHSRERIDLGHLEDLDHLDVQRELGEWEWRGGRYG